MEDLKEMEIIYSLKEIIILVNLKVQCKMVKVYYKNGIKYEGDFKNNVSDGNGKYIWKNGSYYIGQWIKDLKHCKGKLYYENNNIKYDGDYKMDLFDGYEKYIDQNGEYFIGQWSNGMKVKGIIYSKDNKVLYEGDFI